VSTTNTNTFPLGLIHTVPGSCISKCGRSAHFASARFFTSSGNLFAMMRVGYQREREAAYEDLKSTVTLAMLMGYKVVFDRLSQTCGG
jgi:hypothetical protein